MDKVDRASRRLSRRGNLGLAESLGIDPFVRFRSSSIGHSKGCPTWIRKYREFLSRPEEFDRHYHKRSNVEAHFSALKRSLGEQLLSKTGLAHANELLAKVLAYNVSVAIKQAEIHKLHAAFLGIPNFALPGSERAAAEAG